MLAPARRLTQLFWSPNPVLGPVFWPFSAAQCFGLWLKAHVCYPLKADGRTAVKLRTDQDVGHADTETPREQRGLLAHPDTDYIAKLVVNSSHKNQSW
jgi:hypothetical protein